VVNNLKEFPPHCSHGSNIYLSLTAKKKKNLGGDYANKATAKQNIV
jgi:hypothetical protein